MMILFWESTRQVENDSFALLHKYLLPGMEALMYMLILCIGLQIVLSNFIFDYFSM